MNSDSSQKRKGEEKLSSLFSGNLLTLSPSKRNIVLLNPLNNKKVLHQPNQDFEDQDSRCDSSERVRQSLPSKFIDITSHTSTNQIQTKLKQIESVPLINYPSFSAQNDIKNSDFKCKEPAFFKRVENGKSINRREEEEEEDSKRASIYNFQSRKQSIQTNKYYHQKNMSMIDLKNKEEENRNNKMFSNQLIKERVSSNTTNDSHKKNQEQIDERWNEIRFNESELISQEQPETEIEKINSNLQEQSMARNNPLSSHNLISQSPKYGIHIQHKKKGSQRKIFSMKKVMVYSSYNNKQDFRSSPKSFEIIHTKFSQPNLLKTEGNQIADNVQYNKQVLLNGESSAFNYYLNTSSNKEKQNNFHSSSFRIQNNSPAEKETQTNYNFQAIPNPANPLFQIQNIEQLGIYSKNKQRKQFLGNQHQVNNKSSQLLNQITSTQSLKTQDSFKLFEEKSSNQNQNNLNFFSFINRKNTSSKEWDLIQQMSKFIKYQQRRHRFDLKQSEEKQKHASMSKEQS